MKNRLNIILLLSAVALVVSCVTTSFDKPLESVKEPRENNPKKRKQLELEEQLLLEHYEIEEALKETDIERTVIYVDRPVYSPVERQETPVTGQNAVIKSNNNSIQIPMKFVNGIMYYAWDESFVYEIHTSPYRTTDLMLEPGELVLEMPFLSEEKIWEIGAGVSVEKGLDVQHFFIKPSYSGFTTSMIIITDRRVYHLLLKSFKTPAAGEPERYMAMVRFNYPPLMPFTVKSDKLLKQSDDINNLAFGTNVIDPRLLSFDYKMSYNARRKPVWLPQRVYDDGRKTYIVLDRRMLHTESPVLFNHRNERINYRVHENMIVIDELIERITLRRGKDKVTITKKNFIGKSGNQS
jgi:type IV secretion system protein VirB9